MRPSDEALIGLSDGTQLWTTVTGSGPPVVCCHGGPGLWDYLEPLAALLSDAFTAVRFEQRGCGRSTGIGPFTIAQAMSDLDQLRAAFGFSRWSVLGHSWGAELAVRYAARFPEHTTSVIYIAGVGAGDSFRAAYLAERDRRLGADLARWQELATRTRTAAEEREWCLLQWRSDFSPSGASADHAQALWSMRPAGAAVNSRANRELWGDRSTEDLLELATKVRAPVTMLLGRDDPRPWTATDSLYTALPNTRRVVLDGAGHAPWVECPDAARKVIRTALAAER